ncbi:hypothetical protein V6N13_038528 [Hibiscus sabdariffa]
MVVERRIERALEANSSYTPIKETLIDRGIEMMRRMQRMNHGVTTNSSYTPIIHAQCEAGRVLEAKIFFSKWIAYNLVCGALNSAN